MYTVDGGELLSHLQVSRDASEQPDIVKTENETELLRKIGEHDQGDSADSEGKGTTAQPELAARVSGRLPVPAGDTRDDALAVFREIYEPEFKAARTASQRQGLAAKLRNQAAELAGDAVGQFVLLDVAMRISTQSGDVNGALAAIDEMAKTFEIDRTRLVSEVLREADDRELTKTADHRLADEATRLIDLAIAADDFNLAGEMQDIAAAAARRLNDRQLIKDALARRDEIHAARSALGRVKRLLELLGESPDDPAANLAAGQYYCFVKGEWKRGLIHLAKGSDQTLAELARNEMGPPQTAREQLELADAWWDLADKSRNHRKQLQLRAAKWYLHVVPQLEENLLKVRAELRLKQVEQAYGRDALDSA